MDKKIFPVPDGIRNPGHPARGAVSIPTALSRLLIIDISMWTYLFFLAQERVDGRCRQSALPDKVKNLIVARYVRMCLETLQLLFFLRFVERAS